MKLYDFAHTGYKQRSFLHSGVDSLLHRMACNGDVVQ